MEWETLVCAAKKHDAVAFAKLYEQIYRELYQFAYYMLRHSEDAKDVVSETVTDAWETIEKLEKETSFRAWMFSILSNKCRRKRKDYLNRPGELSDELQNSLPAEEHLSGEERLQIREAYARLDEIEQQIIGLHVFGGYKTREIASLLHMNENTVRSREHRALKKMRDALNVND